MKQTRSYAGILIPFIVILLAIPGIYKLPPVQERVGWRVAEVMARIKYALSPPERAVFVPQEMSAVTTAVLTTSQTTTVLPSRAAAIRPSGSPASPTPTGTPGPLPASMRLTGFTHEYQTWNNCGPATLAMALSYWGWEGDQRAVAAFTKSNPRDKNVMPYELAAYVKEQTKFNATVRVGGDMVMLRRFLAAGLPVMIEKGFESRQFDGWMGHYVLVTAYNDPDHRFTVQDSYYGPDQAIRYEDLESNWRAFDFTYLLIYPDDRQHDVTATLGLQADEEYNNRYAADQASDEVSILAGRDQFFAWFNRGTNLVQLEDYAGAAAAYDQAFALYPAIPAKQRPWRMLWYQTGPYEAYCYSGRYQDVLRLATTTLDAMSEPVLEESYYWRALAREALGDKEGATSDLRTTLKYHPGFEPTLAEYQRLGMAP